VVAGDTFATLGQKLYGDPQMGLLIAALLGVDPAAKPALGSTLILPRVVEVPKAPVLDIDQELAAARKLLADEEFAAAAALMDKVLQQEPANSEARSLADQAYFESGKRLHLQQRYREAREAFKKVSPGYRDTDAFLAVIRQQLEKEAETHYRRGVNHFVNEDLAEAIAEWQQTLVLNPEHRKAAQDIENARELLKKLEQVGQSPVE
jgi:tetratricopeptide (TPR) repeat protein